MFWPNAPPLPGVGENKAKSKKQGRNEAFLLFRTKNREEIRKWVGGNIQNDGQNIYPWGYFLGLCSMFANSSDFREE